MATRYWGPGGNGLWSSTSNWSTSSAGTPTGASVPGSADAAIFNSSSGSGTATVDSNVTIQTLNLTNFPGTLAFGTNTISLNSTGTVFNANNTHSVSGTPVIIVTSTGSTAIGVTPGTSVTEANSISFKFTGGTYVLSFLIFANSVARDVDFTGFAGTWTSAGIAASTIYGSLTLSTGMTITASTNALTFGASSGTQIITSNGKTFTFPLNINSSNGVIRLADAMTVGTSNRITHTNGTLDLNGKTLTVGTSSNAYITAVGTKTLTFNGGTLICPAAATGAFNNNVPANFSTVAGTGTGKISMTAATGKSFVGGGSVYNCTLSNDGAGNLTITGSNTFTTLTNGVQPATFSFTAGTTTTVTNWDVNGTSVNFVTIQSSGAGTHTLSKSSGYVASQYLTITNSVATGGATWYSLYSTNVSGNTGWLFGVNKYWVGGTGNWSDVTKWATSSGGAGGSGITAADAAVFDASSGTGISTVDSNVSIQTLTIANYTGSLSLGANTISLLTFGNVYTGGTGYTASGNPFINLTYPGARTTTITPASAGESNAISFNITSGTYNFANLSNPGSVRSLDFTGFSGVVGGDASHTDFTMYGNLTLSPTSTFATSPSTTISFRSTSATTQIITTNGVVFGSGVSFNGIGGTWQFADNFITARSFSLSNGTIDLNGKNISLTGGTFDISGSGTKNITFNGASIYTSRSGVTAFNNTGPTGFTTTAGTGIGKIILTSSSAKTFAGGGSTFNCTVSNGGAGLLTISGNNTIDTVTTASGNIAIAGSNTITTISNSVQPVTFTLNASTTQTITNWNVNGTAGNLVTITSSTAGTAATLSKTSGTVSSDYLSLKDSTATGGATWYAGANSTNVSGNTGWIFSGPPVAYSITALNGTYALNGQSIGIARNRNLSGSYGSYSVSGQSVVVTRSRSLFGSYGSYSVSGQTAGIFRSRSLEGSYGSYSLTGQTAVITYTVVTVNYTITADAGSYMLNGQSIGITRDRSLTSDYGFYGVTGQTADIYRSRALNSGYGVYALTGSSADLVFGRTLTASPGDYAVTGQDATLTKSNLLSAENGLYSLAGQAVNITYSGAPVETVTQYWIEIRSFTESRRI